ncbi:CDP-glycerol glycerophosphotransferase family protein [Blastococcus goldschmidtiae]|uniref:CDP-glycerol glycerophosphotransferase family protein n=1 Tax=Blastococcus goldschmidtiae TaxID=3075546 RepID=A0ABU2K4I3_9ACTN|nr:CDP-glycerol glycerophosphotransferase family protein [Blastococcus sp. DSM 46792]MDT0275107.1 CDP-glycerol glycerophosphotransferase family protein [Blastococcus sp. DSM 46792]
MLFVYNSFLGQYSDNPRAIYERLFDVEAGHAHVWLRGEGHDHAFPEGVDTVALGTPDSVAALEAADVVVSNICLEPPWTKRPEAVYLQTWHGTPLKLIHYDEPSVGPDDDERLGRDVARWDCLLSPNRASTARLRSAFRFGGRVVETGYPRNDVLVAGDRDLRRAAVRARLGLDDGTRAVLYAPTWRDDERDALDVPLGLDVDSFVAGMGEGCSLLVRTHYYMAGRTSWQERPGVLDVSGYPDIRDLYLAADVLVTDYSSVMFDFAVTGKPMVFYAYDLAHYRDSLRGFYFDLLAEAPGPVVESLPALLDALSRPDAMRVRYGDRYDRFRERYCHLDDGRATDRAIELLVPGR